MTSYSRVEEEHARRQKMIIGVLIVLTICFVALRVRLAPGYSEDEFAILYDDLCTEIQSDGDGKELFKRAKKQMRKAGTKPEVLFFFQFVGIYADELHPPRQLIEIEIPIREAVLAGRFDEAMSLTHHAMLETDAMTAGRGEAWGKMIRELRSRWTNGCRKPAEEASSAP